MENIEKIGTQRLEELKRRIAELDEAHAHLKQDMLKLMISSHPKNSQSAFSKGAALSNFNMHGGGVTQHSAYRLTEAHYYNILESINQNQAWQNFYGYTAAETVGKDFIELVVEPWDAQIAYDYQQQILKGEIWAGPAEFPVLNKKRERFVVFGSCNQLCDENGKIVGTITISAALRGCQEIRTVPCVGAPRRIASPKPIFHPLQKSMTNYDSMSEDRPLASKAEWTVKNGISWLQKGYERGSRFYSRTRRFCRHRIYCDLKQENAVQRSSSITEKIESQLYNTLVPCSSSIDKVNEIKWEDFIISERIGKGSYGTVYHAMWNGSDVALKLLSKQEYSHDLILAFRLEVSLMKRLRHPNVLLFMGTVTSPERLCIVTEFLRCGSLFHLLHRSTVRLDWKHRVQIAVDIARGMNYLHRCLPPIIHCDLKSSNLRVDQNWKVKIGDFGLCRIKHESYVTIKEGTGTPEWTAPEVILNEQADEKSDVYSYGVLLWEITTEKIPWDGLSSMQVIKAVAFMNQRLDIPKDVDPRWASLIERCLCSEPEYRPTFQEILDDLKVLQKRPAVRLEASTPQLHTKRNRKNETTA
ncbi:PAS domain-containing protein tyrosine kinase family protein [Tanacetum coccineum]|uniref:PAS domain-containing protein tyrosine kinase family protein n=1 Tax=Tanacetum coccineum TaxID=301880 RepID=A0ABQ5BWQ2_9ASTR